ncbi:outer membrane protein [Alsobacter sp. R-9]
MHSWSGFYVGVQAGYSWGEDETTADIFTLAVPTFGLTKYDVNGFVAGAHAGYNFQSGPAVIGLEVDFEGVGYDGNKTLTDTAFGSGMSVSGKTSANWQSSLRARVGYALNTTLLYVTGGLALANFQNTYAVSDPLGFIFAPGTYVAKNTQVATGYTIGAGIEQAFSPNVTARLEYRFTQYGSFNYSPIPVALELQQEPYFHTVRAGVSYKF